MMAFTNLAALTYSLENVLDTRKVQCGACNSFVTLEMSHSSPLQGMIARLPNKSSVPLDSFAHRQPDTLNDGAFCHPCLIAANSECGHMVFCMPITSFGKRTISVKFAPAELTFRQRKFGEYLALAENDTIPHNAFGELQYLGPRMDGQSYVRLEGGYWIELANLKQVNTRQLTPEASAKARMLYSALESKRILSGKATATHTDNWRSNPTPVVIPDLGMHDEYAPWREMASISTLEASAEPLFVVPRTGTAAIEIKVA